MFVFRVAANRHSGLGHLTRCVWLSEELIQRGHKVVFYIDELDQKHLPFIDSLDVKSIYTDKTTEIDSSLDAQLFVDECARLIEPINWVVVDHYELDQTWELAVKKSLGTNLCAIDDLLREHSADALLDYRWRGQQTQTAYDLLISSHCSKLLGVDYVLLPPEINKIQDALSNYQCFSYKFNVLISLGGGGNGIFLIALLKALVEKHVSGNVFLNINLVIGPFLTQTSELLSTIKQLNKQSASKFCITPLENVPSLVPHLGETDFYIGAAGSTLYQLRALKIPAITFSLAENQLNDLQELADIGHYFHLNQLSLTDLPIMAEFFQLCVLHYQRIYRLFDKAKIALDAKGSVRVADFLLNQSILTPQVKSLLEVERVNGWQMIPVDDQDIVHYLTSRNLNANRQNMITNQCITPLEHFRWWFTTQRSSYKLQIDEDTTKLYIWHELKSIGDESFLVGGWFVCQQTVNITEALYALDWQLKTTEQQYPGVTWLAVIHRDNKAVKRLNDYFGFKEIEQSSRYYSQVKQLFPKANASEFYYVYK
jgi:UDP-2,4-diacetamido-2,4,6-trideoxy-beta-L-altropyranose hydrolase